MPKVTLTKTQKLNEAMSRIYRHISSDFPQREKLCSLMGYSVSTHQNRKKDPGTFTLEELRIAYKLSDVSDMEFMKIIREEKDARYH